jgi:hypothetical protein
VGLEAGKSRTEELASGKGLLTVLFHSKRQKSNNRGKRENA